MNTLITNNQTSNFYNHLEQALNCCNSFIFNVAFINFSGLQLLLDSFKNLEQKGVKGKILTSTYLNFTQVEALRKIKEFKNIELKIYDNSSSNIGFHSKAYIFEFDDEYEILLGSSNITASAFKTNIEWNIKTLSKKEDLFLNEILNEFNTLWNDSYEANEEFLIEYENFKKSQEENSFKKQFILKNPKNSKTLNANYMQNQALEKLEDLRSKGEKKALVLAATGTGKTYLAAFDIKQCKPKTMLFIVHRENILIKAKQSFEEIIDTNITCGLYTGNTKELDKEYIFTTIQTMSLNYENFKKEQFDYIVVDEAHHVVSPSYKKVLRHFKAKFLLGLTASANRTDGQSIYKEFDENIACDITLSLALENKLISSFHYFGISDINSIDYSNIDISKIDELVRILKVNKRVEYIIEKMNFYSYSQANNKVNNKTKRKVLGFCVSKEHCIYMSEQFNKKGINATYLVSNNSITQREEAIKNLEDETNSLEVIFTVDIFNEGIDIPSINTVLMLRPTSSPIIFIQQLGRGLRKYKNKEFLTVLDFIGNHNKAYLIALALVGAKAIDKESIKISVENNFANMQNAFIKMDEISKQRILEQINSENFNHIKYLKEQYNSFRQILGNKEVKLVDYLEYEELISPLGFISHSKSYIEFLAIVEEEKALKEICNDEVFIKAIRFIDYLLPVKRVYEFVILKYLLSKQSIDEKTAFKVLGKYLDVVNKDTILHSFNFLNQNYFDKAQLSRYQKLVSFEDEKLVKTREFEALLANKRYKEIFEDSIDYGIMHYEKEFSSKDYGLPFLKLYQKYNMLNIAQLCNFNKIHSSFRGSGFLKYQDDFFLFINLEKEKFSKASYYDNTFLSKDTFTYQSKPSTAQDSVDGNKLINNKKLNVKLHIFVRKYAQVDKKTQGFIYLGLANTIKYEGNKPIATTLKLEKALDDKIYEEFTKIVD
ncbi:MAG: DEAD/DEAH box helicase [Poseidonibacter sp.]